MIALNADVHQIELKLFKNGKETKLTIDLELIKFFGPINDAIRRIVEVALKVDRNGKFKRFLNSNLFKNLNFSPNPTTNRNVRIQCSFINRTSNIRLKCNFIINCILFRQNNAKFIRIRS
jgi:hypothetical protein